MRPAEWPWHGLLPDHFPWSQRPLLYFPRGLCKQYLCHDPSRWPNQPPPPRVQSHICQNGLHCNQCQNQFQDYQCCNKIGPGPLVQSALPWILQGASCCPWPHQADVHWCQWQLNLLISLWLLHPDSCRLPTIHGSRNSSGQRLPGLNWWPWPLSHGRLPHSLP